MMCVVLQESPGCRVAPPVRESREASAASAGEQHDRTTRTPSRYSLSSLRAPGDGRLIAESPDRQGPRERGREEQQRRYQRPLRPFRVAALA